MVKKKSNKPEHSLLGITISSYNVAISAAVNPEMKKPYDCLSNEKINLYDTCLEIQGTCHYPSERYGELFTIVLKTEDGSDELTLKDCRVLDDKGMYVMRTIGGRKVPAYETPRNLGRLVKRRGENHWDLSLGLPKVIIANMLSVLPNVSPLYLDFHEVKYGRVHEIRNMSLQMNDPAVS